MIFLTTSLFYTFLFFSAFANDEDALCGGGAPMTNCIDSPAGRFQDAEVQAECKECLERTYQDQSGQELCIKLIKKTGCIPFKFQN